ncbi:MAG: amino acid permease [Roseivirga sp.]
MRTLSKKLGPLDGAILIFSNVVGVGIFTTPGIVAASVTDQWLFLSTWLVGGIFAFIGAHGYAKLSTTYPKAGGEYIYLKKSFGPLAGFLSGWTSFVAGFSGAIAASAVGFAFYLKRALPDMGDTLFGVATEPMLAIILILGVDFIHIISVKAGSRFHYWLGGLAIIAIIGLVVLGLVAPATAAAAPTKTPVKGTAFLLALVPVLFTYSGWNAAVYLAEEIRNPDRNLYKSLILGTTAVVLIYLVLNLLFVKILGLEAMSNSLEVGFDMAYKLLGETGSIVITIIILLALLSSVSAMIMAGPRIYFAMARDRLFPRQVEKLHTRFHTPAIAILAQSLWSALLVITGTFEDILIYTGFSIILFSGLSIFSLLTNPAFKVSALHKLLYGLFVLVSLFILGNAIYSAPKPSLFGAGIILLGIPVYYFFKGRGQR